MNRSMWVWTAVCLACGAPDFVAGAEVAPPGPAPGIAQGTDTCCQDQPRAPVGRLLSGTSDCICAENGGACSESPGVFARLRSLFRRCGSDSCGETCGGNCETAPPPIAANSGDDESHGLGLRQRLANIFHRSGREVPCCEPEQTVIAQMAPARPVLQPAVPAAIPVQPVSEIRPVSVMPSRPTMEIRKEYLDKVGHADDYSWLTGELFYIHIHADQGLWVVRYAPVDREDRYGGSVVLAPVTSMADFHEGDLVTVHGDILNQGRASRHLGGPLYRGLAVELKQRGH